MWEAIRPEVRRVASPQTMAKTWWVPDDPADPRLHRQKRRERDPLDDDDGGDSDIDDEDDAPPASNGDGTGPHMPGHERDWSSFATVGLTMNELDWLGHTDDVGIILAANADAVRTQLANYTDGQVSPAPDRKERRPRLVKPGSPSPSRLARLRWTGDVGGRTVPRPNARKLAR